eukprot:scaffold328133_cov14-Prasinocladus_malaysianus.AAC.1
MAGEYDGSSAHGGPQRGPQRGAQVINLTHNGHISRSDGMAACLQKNKLSSSAESSGSLD